MSELTRRGVCHKLYKSPYTLQVVYGETKVTYYFSSEYNVTRFKDNLESNRKKYNESLSKRFKFEIKSNIIADLKLYERMEVRGFFISANGVTFDCLEKLKLDGENLTNKS